MRISALAFASVALAARPWLEEPDTGIEEALGGYVKNKTLPPLSKIVGLPDFDWVARHFMNTSGYTYYRNGAGGEWSYRNNLEIFQRFPLRPRVLRDILNVEASLETTILGKNYSVPFFIAPAARGALAHPDGEINLVHAAAEANVLYCPSLSASKTIEEITAAKVNGSQTLWQQVYLSNNDTEAEQLIRRIERAGRQAIIMTVDSAGDGVRHRAQRYDVGSADTGLSLLTWPRFHKLQNMTSLPIIPKGIQTVQDAREAVNQGVKAIYLSNHGGRQLDTSPSALEVAIEIYNEDPEIFKQVDVYADGGVRYGTDIIKLLALGVKAVGIGRPAYFANVFGKEGIVKMVDLLRTELINDAANLGLANIKDVNASYVNWRALNVWGM